MNRKLTVMVAMAAACAAVQLAAMPTEKETRRAEPVVRKLLEPERKALRSGKKTRSEVANAAMKLAAEADTEAAKLLLMKGAFVLYVQDGNLAKAAEAMNAIKAAIPDMPPKSVTNMIEAALLGASKKGERAQLYKLLDEVRPRVAIDSLSAVFDAGKTTCLLSAALGDFNAREMRPFTPPAICPGDDLNLYRIPAPVEERHNQIFPRFQV